MNSTFIFEDLEDKLATLSALAWAVEDAKRKAALPGARAEFHQFNAEQLKELYARLDYTSFKGQR